MTPDKWRQIEDLYLATVELNGMERAALLDHAHSDIRREVEAMLAQPTDSCLLDRSAWFNDLEPSTAVTVGPGVQLGQYKIEAAIGAGGMGVVFRAIDTKLGRRVAIKFLSDEIADDTARRRFQVEGQMASSLSHPHILTVHDAGEFGGRQYLVTEFVEGGTLRTWRKLQPRRWEDVTQILTGVADALATVHEAGVVHRDVKPDNILVTASGYAKLADFGLAQPEDVPPLPATEPDGLEPIPRGLIIGTLGYMSPEQVSGGTLDGRSDMFSFGVVLYEMLTGRRPFAATTRRDLIEKLIHAPPPPLQGDLPHWLRALITRALQKDPRDRFPSMRELVETLRVAQRLGGRSAAPALWLWPTVAGIVLEAECVSIWKIAAARKLTISYLPSAPLASDKLAVITTHPA